MSRYYPLSPVERYCPNCDGYGFNMGDGLLAHCPACDGIGRVSIEGGPLFGCKYTLKDAKPGQIVTLGNGDRGRVIRHNRRGTPTTDINLIHPFLDDEATEATSYPNNTGVASMSASSWLEKPPRDARHDHLDPLQKGKLL